MSSWECSAQVAEMRLSTHGALGMPAQVAEMRLTTHEPWESFGTNLWPLTLGMLIRMILPLLP